MRTIAWGGCIIVIVTFTLYRNFVWNETLIEHKCASRPFSAKRYFVELASVGATFEDTDPNNYLLFLKDVLGDGTYAAIPNTEILIKRRPELVGDVCHHFIVFCFVRTSDKRRRDYFREHTKVLFGLDESSPLVFVMGDDTDKMESIDDRDFPDVLIGDFKDTYSTLTIKQQLMLQYIDSLACKPQYIVKHDADVVVNYRLFRKIISKKKIGDRGIYGCIGAYDKEVIRDHENRWMERYDAWPFAHHIDYVLGAMYYVTGNVAATMARTPLSVHVGEINNEDVYMGMRSLVEGLRVANDSRIWANENDAHNHYGVTDTADIPCDKLLAVTSEKYNEKEMFRLHHSLKIKCGQ